MLMLYRLPTAECLLACNIEQTMPNITSRISSSVTLGAIYALVVYVIAEAFSNILSMYSFMFAGTHYNHLDLYCLD